jgi:hypothetical protein
MDVPDMRTADPDPSRRSWRKRWGTVGKSMAMFGLFWLACVVGFGLASGQLTQSIGGPPYPSRLSDISIWTVVCGCLLAVVVLPWIGIATATWARRAGAGVGSLVAFALNAFAALLVVSVLGLSLAWWASS